MGQQWDVYLTTKDMASGLGEMQRLVNISGVEDVEVAIAPTKLLAPL